MIVPRVAQSLMNVGRRRPSILNCAVAFSEKIMPDREQIDTLPGGRRVADGRIVRGGFVCTDVAKDGLICVVRRHLP